MIQQFHSWVYIQKKWKYKFEKETCAPIFIAALLWSPRRGSDPSDRLTGKEAVAPVRERLTGQHGRPQRVYKQ